MMERQRRFSVFCLRFAAIPLRSRVALGATLGASILGAAIFFGGRRPSINTSSGRRLGQVRNSTGIIGASGVLPEPQFPRFGPTPSGTVTMHDIEWGPVATLGHSWLDCPLRVGYDQGKLEISDGLVKAGVWSTAANQLANVLRLPPPSHKRVKHIVWSGPASGASFTVRTVGGVHTVNDAANREVWSDVSVITASDFLLEINDKGQAHLSGPGGTTLWSGAFPITAMSNFHVPTAFHSGNHTQRGTYQIEFSDVHLTGNNGVFTLRSGNGPVLWSGNLSKNPVLVIRQKDQFLLQTPTGSEAGSNHNDQVDFKCEAGSVTIEDAQGNVLGTRPVDILVATTQTGPSNRNTVLPTRVEFCTPNARLMANGTIFLTYRDHMGRVVRRSKAYNTGRSSSTIS